MFDWHISLWVYFLWISVCLDLGGYFLSHVRGFFDYNLNKYFLIPFLFPFFFWNLYNLDVGALNVVPRASEAVFIPFHPFFFILLCFNYFHPSSHICFSASVIMLLVSSSISFVSFCCLLLIFCSLFILGPCKIFHVSS